MEQACHGLVMKLVLHRAQAGGERGGKEEREGGLDHSDERRVLPGPI